MKLQIRLSIVLLWLLIGCLTAKRSWKLVWEDDFNGKELDLTKWSYDYGENWFHNELQAYTNNSRNVYLKDGMLHLKAIKETYKNKNYTSGRIFTRYTASWMYGRFEARMKMPSGQGMWPAFWMLPVWLDWPQYGEIDVMEYLGHQPTTQYGTMHYAKDYFHLNSRGGIYKSPRMLNESFNVYATEWLQDEIKLYFNDIMYFSLKKSQIKEGELWPFEGIPFYIILNLAVGGNWPGPPDNTTVFPQEFLVDYVRIYQS